MTSNGKLTPTFTKPQLVNLFDTISTPKVAVACFLALTHGLRILETCRIKWKDIDFDNNKIWIMNSKWKHRRRDGYGKDRWCPLNPHAKDILQRWRNYIGGGDWVFPSDTNPDQHIRQKSLYEQFKVFLKAADLNHTHLSYNRIQITRNGREKRTVDKSILNFHSFRKFYVSNLVKKGVPVPIIADNVGHQDISTTQTYIRIDDTERMRMTMKALQQPTEVLRPNPPQPDVYAQPAMQYAAVTAEEKLKMQLINNEISEEEYVRKLQLLNPEGIKKVIELKARED